MQIKKKITTVLTRIEAAPKLAKIFFFQLKAHFKQRHKVPLFENIRFHRLHLLTNIYFPKNSFD